MQKITYILGAGASFQAIPILNEMSEKMILFANDLLKPLIDKPNKDKINFLNDREEYNINLEDEHRNLQFDIGYFGEKAKEFNTIDTYAKKIFLTESTEAQNEYIRLKKAVSYFFYLFQERKGKIQIEEDDKGNQRKISDFKDIDSRYISLLSAFLNKSKNNPPVLDERINFISWNYDSQLELAYKKFSDSEDGFNNFSDRVFHLNGVYDDFGKNKSDDFFKVNKSDLNYSWDWISENNEKYVKIKSVLRESNYLVVIGYSFPHFNRKVDIELINSFFEKPKNKNQSGFKSIMFQDPNATKETILGLKDRIEENIKIDHSTAQFYLPNEYFRSIENEFNFDIR